MKKLTDLEKKEYDIARRLIEQNIEMIETRLLKVVDIGIDHPCCLIYDLASIAAQRIPIKPEHVEHMREGKEKGLIAFRAITNDRERICDILIEHVIDENEMQDMQRMCDLLFSHKEPETFPVISVYGQTFLGMNIKIGESFPPIQTDERIIVAGKKHIAANNKQECRKNEN